MVARKRRGFRLRDFRGVNPEQVAKLEAQGIRYTEQLLAAGGTHGDRAALAAKAGVPESVVLELVRLSDLARLPGVKGIRARLYYDAGVDSIERMAAWEPQALLRMLGDYVERTGFDGIAPLPKEVQSCVARARGLPRIVEY